MVSGLLMGDRQVVPPGGNPTADLGWGFAHLGARGVAQTAPERGPGSA